MKASKKGRSLCVGAPRMMGRRERDNELLRMLEKNDSSSLFDRELAGGEGDKGGCESHVGSVVSSIRWATNTFTLFLSFPLPPVLLLGRIF